MAICCFNGEWVEDAQHLLAADNRSFLYGDGLFETMRLVDGHLLFAADHLQRLSNGAKVLGLQLPPVLSVDGLLQLAADAAQRNQYTHARLRLTVYRRGEGRYQPQTQQTDWLLTAELLPNAEYQLNPEGLRLGLYQQERKWPGPLAACKTTNALLYVLAAQHAQQQGWDGALLLNTHGRVVEATASNLFLVKDTHLHTPSLAEGPVAGVMRKQVLRLVAEEGYGLSSGQVTVDMLAEADEVLLTNTIRGVQWVQGYGSKTYQHKVAAQLVQLLNQSIKR